MEITTKLFMAKSVLSQHINAVWRQHNHQVVNKAVAPYLLEAVSIISSSLASLANSPTKNQQAWEDIIAIATLAKEAELIQEKTDMSASESVENGLQPEFEEIN